MGRRFGPWPMNPKTNLAKCKSHEPPFSRLSYCDGLVYIFEQFGSELFFFFTSRRCSLLNAVSDRALFKGRPRIYRILLVLKKDQKIYRETRLTIFTHLWCVIFRFELDMQGYTICGINRYCTLIETHPDFSVSSWYSMSNIDCTTRASYNCATL
jgi:hypothetical protein